jgi:hypothetical protein
MAREGKEAAKLKTINAQTRLYLIATLIQLLGLSSSVLIYGNTDKTPDSGWDYDSIHSKEYRHDLDLIGGKKANVLTGKFRRWFGGLWHGQTLAFTTAFIAHRCFGRAFLHWLSFARSFEIRSSRSKGAD